MDAGPFENWTRKKMDAGLKNENWVRLFEHEKVAFLIRKLDAHFWKIGRAFYRKMDAPPITGYAEIGRRLAIGCSAARHMKRWMRARIGPAEDFSLSKLGMPGPEIGHPENKTSNEVQTKGAHVPCSFKCQQDWRDMSCGGHPSSSGKHKYPKRLRIEKCFGSWTSGWGEELRSA